jgi:hypothetical protein
MARAEFESMEWRLCSWRHLDLLAEVALVPLLDVLYLWIFSRLSSTVMRALLKLASSRLDASVAAAAAGSRPGLMLLPIWRAPPRNGSCLMHALCAFGSCRVIWR